MIRSKAIRGFDHPNSAAPSRPSLSLRILLVLLCTAFCAATGALGQVDTGSIQGTVTDSSGAIVPGAMVTLTNEQTASIQTQPTREDGQYLFTPVRVGIYKLTITAPGFEMVEEQHLSLAVQQRAVIDLKLSVGNVMSDVEVMSAEPLLQARDASVGLVVEEREINSLPLNGRNYTLLAQLSPGVTTAIYDAGHGFTASGSFSANGLYATYNNYLLDGISNNNLVADFGDGAAYVVKPPPDALTEFKVQTANYSAEFGPAGGAVINAITKSGTNKIYGAIWEYFRNDAMDANDYFLNNAGQKKPEYRRNQFGIALGGPLVIPHLYNGHNKTFLFGDYEGTRIIEGIPYTASVPTALERSSGFTNFTELLQYQTGTQTDNLGRKTPIGTLFDPATLRTTTKGVADPVTHIAATATGYVRDPFAGNIVPSNRVSSVAANLALLYPVPNLPGITSNYVSAPKEVNPMDAFDTRIDHTLSQKDSMFARGSYFYNPEVIPTPLGGLAQGSSSATIGNQTSKAVNMAVGETHIFSPTLVNEFRVGYSRLHMDRLQPQAEQGGLNQQYGIPGIPDGPPNGGLAQIKITGLNELGTHNNLPLDEIGASIQYSDNVSKELNKHSLRFGVVYSRQKTVIDSSSVPHGAFTFTGSMTDQYSGNTASTGLAQFIIEPQPDPLLSGNANCAAPCYEGGATQIQASPLALEDYRRPYFGAYIQDNYRFFKNVTFDLGLRYEFFELPTDHNGKAANFVPGTATQQGLYLIDDRSKNVPLSPSFTTLLASSNIALQYTSNHTLANQRTNYISPRVGIAFQASPRAVFRAGYGIFYAGMYNRGAGYGVGDTYPFNFTVNLTQTTQSALAANGSIGGIDKGLSGVPLDPSIAVGSQIAELGYQYNSHVPYAQSMNFSLQYQLSETQSFTIGYVGSLTRHVEGNVTDNLPSQILTPGTTITPYLPYPLLPSGNRYAMFEGTDNYNSLQARYDKAFSNGLYVLGNYTWSKLLGDGSDSNIFTGTKYRAPYVPAFGLRGDYGPGDLGISNIFHVAGGYHLPFGKGRKYLNNNSVVDAFVGGWNITGLWTLQSGLPFTVACTVTTTPTGSCDSLANHSTLYTGAKNITHWVNSSAFSNPASASNTTGTLGPASDQTNIAPFGGQLGQAVGPRFHRDDFGLQKDFRMPWSSYLEFRAEAFNLTNTPNFGTPGTLTPSSTAFASITTTFDSPNDPRQIQFALKYVFGGGDK